MILFDKITDIIRKVNQALWANYSLRKCNSIGKFCRVVGRVVVNNSGQLHLGEKIRIRGSHVPVELATLPGGKLFIGDRTGINSGVSICAQELVSIGKNCMIGNYTLIMDTDFHVAGDYDVQSDSAPIIIGDGVWLAARVTVLKGVTIGEGAVVAAGSVVSADVLPYTLVGGVPARGIRRLEPKNIPDAASNPT